jgi:hypothetical protein
LGVGLTTPPCKNLDLFRNLNSSLGRGRRMGRPWSENATEEEGEEEDTVYVK